MDRTTISRRIVIVVITCLTVAVGFLVALPGPSTASTANAAGRAPGEAWATVSGGGYHTCGIRTDHTLWCWGKNSLRPARARRLRRTGHARPRSATAPTGHSVSAGDDAHLRAPAPTTPCGAGDATATASSGSATPPSGTPPPRSAPTADWAHVSAAGYAHTCGTRTDHTLWCWGVNWNRPARARRHRVDRTIPTQVGTDTDWARVGAGDSHTCATRTDHTLWCWGYNATRPARARRHHGPDHARPRSAPTPTGPPQRRRRLRTPAPPAPTTPCGAGDTTARRSSGSATPPTGPPRPRSAPTPTGPHLTAGHRHTCGTRTDHTLWCWGDNTYGQLGLGDTTDRTIPTQVGTDTNWARRQRRRQAHLRHPHRPHPVVLGR